MNPEDMPNHWLDEAIIKNNSGLRSGMGRSAELKREYYKRRGGVSLDLPYPKVMFDRRDRDNVVFALNDSEVVILFHERIPSGKKMPAQVEDTFSDFDGWLDDKWIPIIAEHSELTDLQHIEKRKDYRLDTVKERELGRGLSEFFSRSHNYEEWLRTMKREGAMTVEKFKEQYMGEFSVGGCEE